MQESNDSFDPANGPGKLLRTTAYELLALEPIKKSRQSDTRLQRSFQQIEKLPTKEKHQLVKVIDTFLKAAQLPEPSPSY